ncbi:thiamine pyrophosphate-dependent dehydrogenase E1 component subunit alpha [Nonomuraea sp. NPDC050783]|uniref:thiamine pyrophosphate-dependent dehydrogenase E1 component subunit alpha n=1 Tax=Nonomuraea sp. NPDC050783 TaxID=3154634 RepID=UPI003467E566
MSAVTGEPAVREAGTAGLTPPAAADLDRLLLIRHFESALLRLFGDGLLSGTTHTCLGQEHVPVALNPLLREDDFTFSHHRGHGHFLARYGDEAGALLAEIMGRQGALCDGVGGSQHLYHRTFMSTGVQGESLPVAVGMALRLRRAGHGALACAYLGDGTWGEGSVYEALNLAALWHAPLLVVVENNGIAQSTPTERGMAGTIAGRVAAFGIPYLRIDSIDLAAVRGELAGPVAAVREGSFPLVVEFVTRRLGPHSKGDDTRGEDELRRARAAGWYERYAAAFPDRFAAADGFWRRYVDDLVAEVSARPPAYWTVR